MMLSGLIKQRRQLPAVHCWQAQTHWITEPFDGMYPKKKNEKETGKENRKSGDKLDGDYKRGSKVKFKFVIYSFGSRKSIR